MPRAESPRELGVSKEKPRAAKVARDLRTAQKWLESRGVPAGLGSFDSFGGRRTSLGMTNLGTADQRGCARCWQFPSVVNFRKAHAVFSDQRRVEVGLRAGSVGAEE
jgi:hypothetical protein